MRKIYLVMIYSSLLSSCFYAQDEFKSAITRGSKALLFQFSGFSNLGADNFEGGVGGKYYMTGNIALRVSLLLSTASVTIPANPQQGQIGREGELSGTQFGINAAAEYHFGRGRVSPYFGGGIGIGTTSTNSKPPVVGAAGTNLVQSEISNRIEGEQIGDRRFDAGTAFSVFGQVGVEVFLYRELSLAAEYRIGILSVSRADQELTINSVTTTTEGGSATGFGIDSQGFITLAVYF